MYTMKFARLPTGNVQIKKESILLFFLVSKFLWKVGREKAVQVMLSEETGVRRMSPPRASFSGRHLYILKLPGAWVVQKVFHLIFFACLQLYLTGKISFFYTMSCLYVRKERLLMPDLCLFSLISLKLKNRCRSSLKGFLTPFLLSLVLK